MSNKANCIWCSFSYKAVKQGREYLYHDEEKCYIKWTKKIIRKLLQADDDHMTSCNLTMGATHPCTCGADEAKRLLASL